MKKLIILILLLSLTAPVFAETKINKFNKALDTVEPFIDLIVVIVSYSVDKTLIFHYAANKACVRISSKLPVTKDHPIMASGVDTAVWIGWKEVFLDKSFGVGDAVFDVLGAASAFRFRNKKLNKQDEIYLRSQIHQAMIRNNTAHRQELAEEVRN